MYKNYLSFKKIFNTKRPFIKHHQGFTLAEILLALTIVGIISMTVIPIMIANSEKAEIAIKVRRYQSIIAQAALNIKNEYGTIINSPMNTSGTDHANGWNTFKSKLTLWKDCGTTTGQNCWGIGTYKFLNGNNWVDFNNYTTSGRGILSDGSSINYESNNYCAGDKSISNTGPLITECGVVFIDTNGPEPPNRGGRDVFSWHIFRDGSILPYGLDDDMYKGCDPTSSDTTGSTSTSDQSGSPGRGGGCTMRVLRDGKIDY